jgi:uncharacterized protein (DUF2141 family)
MTLPIRSLAAVVALAAGTVALAPGAAGAKSGPPVGCSGTASTAWLNVKIEGVRSAKGLIALTLYADNSSQFLAKGGALHVARVDAKAGTTRACLFVPETGVYALAVYHDENANQKFDRSGIGLPAEGYGFTNNPSTVAGLPSFRAVRLNVPEAGLTTQIKLKYP